MEGRRTGAALALEARRRRAFELCPEIASMELDAAKGGAALCRQIANGELPADRAQALMAERSEALAERRAALLGAAGLPRDYLAPSPTCAMCGDTGYVAGVDGRPARCSCFRQLLAENLFAASNIMSAGAGAPGFGDFDETLFSPEADAGKYGHPISPRENIAGIRGSAMGFVRSFGEPPFQNLYFFGRAGTGKTFTAAAIAGELLRAGRVVLYLPATALFNAITEYRTRAFRDDDYSDYIYRSILDAELLIIDDLGTESMTNARYAEFITLLNARVTGSAAMGGTAAVGRTTGGAAMRGAAAGGAAMRGAAAGGSAMGSAPRSTIISTNMDLRALRNAYDERIVSRIIGSFAIIPFFGDDIRLKRRAASGGAQA
jgi:DNA replication protein DnaC